MQRGDFDLDNSGNAKSQDTGVIRRIIQQRGGVLTDQINTETDFVVLGSEPKVPTMTEEELQDPVQKDRFEKARAALDAYNKVREDAIQRGIPIVNQNRFLYYIGFYDQRRR